MLLNDLKALVSDGRFFSVEFIKRTDGTIRKMLARVGVVSHGYHDRPYEPADYGLLTVYDIQAKGFRMIPADNIISLRANGRTHTNKPLLQDRP